MVAGVVEAARERMDDADRTAVRHHQDGLARVALEHLGQEGGDTRAEGLEGLRLQ